MTDTFCEIDRPEQKAAVTQVLTEVYQAGHCGTLTQALMEIGATVCLPNGKPLCDVCPLASLCMARRNGDVLRLPQRIEKKARRKESYTVFLLCCDGKYAVRKRQEKGLLSGLWEYPNAAGILETDAAVAQPADLLILDEAGSAEELDMVEHICFGQFQSCTDFIEVIP